MAVSKEFLDYVAEQLEPFGRFAVRRMFSGAGLFRDGLMFALAIEDVLYLKTDDANRGDFERAGAAPFTYERAGKARATSYYEVPADVLEDPATLSAWVRNSHGVALRKAKAAARPVRPTARSMARAAARPARPRDR